MPVHVCVPRLRCRCARVLQHTSAPHAPNRYAPSWCTLAKELEQVCQVKSRLGFANLSNPYINLNTLYGGNLQPTTGLENSLLMNFGGEGVRAERAGGRAGGAHSSSRGGEGGPARHSWLAGAHRPRGRVDPIAYLCCGDGKVSECP